MAACMHMELGGDVSDVPILSGPHAARETWTQITWKATWLLERSEP